MCCVINSKTLPSEVSPVLPVEVQPLMRYTDNHKNSHKCNFRSSAAAARTPTPAGDFEILMIRSSCKITKNGFSGLRPLRLWPRDTAEGGRNSPWPRHVDALLRRSTSRTCSSLEGALGSCYWGEEEGKIYLFINSAHAPPCINTLMLPSG